MLSLEVAIISERGGRSYNEDACGHWQSERRLCCVLADGAGGHGGGDVASRLAVEALLRDFAAEPTNNGAELAALVRDVNHALLDQRVHGPTQDMHTTVVCLVVDAVERVAHWAHAGDSRLYWFRDGRIADRTRDHSLVQSLIDAGLYDENLLRFHPQRNELVSALGMTGAELVVGASPIGVDIEPGDAFLLCTDGCWEYVDEDALVQALGQADTPDEWLSDLGGRVVAATRTATSHDNYSALAVWVSAAPDA